MYDKSYEYDEDPEVIRAKGEADARLIEAEAKRLEARAKLHPATQIFESATDGLGEALAGIGCVVILGIIAVAIFAPSLFDKLGNGG